MDNKEIASIFRKQAPLRASWLIIVAVILLLNCLALQAEGAIFRIEPSLVLNEEYNDNIFLQGRGSQGEERERIYAYVSRVSPSLTAKYTTSFWDWDLNYTYNYYYYLFKTHRYEQQDQTHNLDLRNRTEVLKDLFFVELRDTYNRVSRDIAIDYTQQSSSAHQVDQNIFLVNPYLVLRPSVNTRIIPGYIFQDTHYLNGSVVNEVVFINHQDNIWYGDAAIDLSSRLTVTAGVRYTQDRNSVISYNKLDAYAGPQYRYAENAYVYARGGKIWFDFVHNQLPRQDYWFWDVGLYHRLSTITLSLTSLRAVVQDPVNVATIADQHTVSISHTLPRSVLTLGGGWIEYRNVMLDQQILKDQHVHASFLYRLTPTMTSTVSTGYQDINSIGYRDINGYVIPSGVTNILLSTFRLDYQLAEHATLSFEYRYINSHSYDIAINNYFSNRYIVEFRKVF